VKSFWEVQRGALGRGITVGLGAPLIVVFSFCLVGIPLAGAALAWMVHGHLQAAIGQRTAASGAAVFVLTAYYLAACFGFVAGVGLAEVVRDAGFPTLAYGTLILTPAAVFFALGSFAFLPHVLFDPRRPRGFGDALGVALELAARVPWYARGGFALLAAALVFGPLLTVELAIAQPWWFAVAPLTWALTLPTLSATLAWRYARFGEVAPAQVGSLPRGLRGLLASAAFVTLVAFGLTMVAALKPLPLTFESRQIPWELETRASGERVPGTDVFVDADALGLVIRTADGGGAGRVEGSPWGDAWAVEHVEGRYRVHLVQTGIRRDGTQMLDHLVGSVEIDSRGVRLDDGVGRRVSERLGWFGGLLWIVGGLCWLLGIAVTARRLVAVRRLESVSASTDRRSEATLRALDGRLRKGEGARLRLVGRRLLTEGRVWIEGAELRVVIPPEGVALVAGDVAALHDGAEVALLGRFPKLAQEAMREAVAPWPSEARLVPGGRSAARAHLTKRAARAGGLWFALATVALGGEALYAILAML